MLCGLSCVTDSQFVNSENVEAQAAPGSWRIFVEGAPVVPLPDVDPLANAVSACAVVEAGRLIDCGADSYVFCERSRCSEFTSPPCFAATRGRTDKRMRRSE